MAESVVDTNVLVMVDADISTASAEELKCIEACIKWLRGFRMDGSDKLVVDLDYKIIREYRQNIPQDGRTRQWLNHLESSPREHNLIEVWIHFDGDGHAILPDHIVFDDPNDRKFIAVALAHKPTPPIINATDTDWEKQKNLLRENGIYVSELCSEYITHLLDGKT